jgi:hypothetical protein
MTSKVNVKKLKETLPTLLTPPNLPLWDKAVLREKNKYRIVKATKNAPLIEQQLFQNIVIDLAKYDEFKEKNWKGNGKNRNHNLY